MFASSPSDSLAFELFGGGVIRVESTNSSYFTGPESIQFPGELLAHTPESVALLKQSGHLGRQWSSGFYISKIGNHPTVVGNHYGMEIFSKSNPKDVNSPEYIIGGVDTVGGAPFGKYTIAAAEMRRLIRQARSRYPNESFDIIGSILPGTKGDEVWRAKASAADFLLRRQVDEEGVESVQCFQSDDMSTACEEWVSSSLLTPPSQHIVSRIVRAILFQLPIPIISEDAGTHRKVHCTCQ